MTLTLIRHGRTDWNRRGLMQGTSDIPLDEVGRDQARAAAEQLAASGQRWDAIVSSPLLRARETAAILAEGLGLQLGDAYPEWTEQHFGVGEGLHDDEVLARWPDWNPPGKEPDAVVVERGAAALQRIAEDFGDRDVILVSHGTIIRFALTPLTGRPFDAHPPLEHLANSRARYRDGRWTVSTIGDIDVELEVAP